MYKNSTCIKAIQSCGKASWNRCVLSLDLNCVRLKHILSSAGKGSTDGGGVVLSSYDTTFNLRTVKSGWIRSQYINGLERQYMQEQEQ